MKILLYTDIHAANIYPFNIKKSKHLFSEYSRIDELYSTLNWIAELTKKYEIAMPINLGDTFHQALRFYVERYNFVVKSIININRASLSKSGVVIEGNHDRADNVSAVDTLNDISNSVLVKNSIKVKYISEINSHFIFVPYIRDPNKTKEAFQTLYRKFKGSRSNLYVFCHLDIKEALEGFVTSTYQMSQFNSYDDLYLSEYRAVFSGHMHFKKKIKDNFYYIGSVLNHNFGDNAERKGITIVDLTSDGYSTRFEENPHCPLFIKINMTKDSSINKIVENIEKEISKYPNTNVYARLYSLNDEDARNKTSEFIRDYSHLFTLYETKSLDTEEEISDLEKLSIKTDRINIFDMIIDFGSKTLFSTGKSTEEIEKYAIRLKRLVNVN